MSNTANDLDGMISIHDNGCYGWLTMMRSCATRREHWHNPFLNGFLEPSSWASLGEAFSWPALQGERGGDIDLGRSRDPEGVYPEEDDDEPSPIAVL
jgi:hypothetical protein